MKKIVLLVALMTTFAMSGAFAQIVRLNDAPSTGFEYVIPADFTNNGTLFGYEEDGNISLYNSDFQFITTTQWDKWLDVHYYDIDNSGSLYDHHANMGPTQTLFNNDSKFEYFVGNDAVWSEGGDRVKGYTSIQIMSEGQVLQTISATQGNYLYQYIDIYKVDNKFYLLFDEVNEADGTWKTIVYRINRSSVTSVLEPVDVDFPMNVFPTVAHRSQPITVQLGEGNNASEVSVIDATGRTVQRVAIQPGQREVVIPAATLPRGLNVVNARNAQSQASYKIIVR